MIIDKKRRGVNWIWPVTPRADDIHFYLEQEASNLLEAYTNLAKYHE
jgi:hypothetical protein